MITFDAMRAIARKDNEAYPDSATFDIFEVDDAAAKRFAESSIAAYVPHIMTGQLPLDHALLAATLAGMRMGLLIAREQAEIESVEVPDSPPEEWTA